MTRAKAPQPAQQDQIQEACRQLRNLRPPSAKLADVLENRIYMMARISTSTAHANVDIDPTGPAALDDLLEATEQLVWPFGVAPKGMH